jgi:hypothetical protein
MRKQGRIFTTENTEEEDRGKGSKQRAPSGLSQAAYADIVSIVTVNAVTL